ncbi:hypothetical protein [Halegenticoccus tardaugens]|uniref:hypothetical protein n=1 Tax=Halegenticoccus tardaugens TaxID=2071624 RepID=UPI00100A9947|nr:hypothetical protein [Halegenticoccus tardaugens]
MAKVSIGLRGWRFDESEIFTDEGEFKPLAEIPDDPKRRLLRLSYLIGKPCDACYLIHGEAEIRRCNESAVVYGEPFEEILLCERHEPDFDYWFREAGGRDLVGENDFRDAFHEWFADGGRAPEGYAGIEHVDTDPDGLPNPPDPQELHDRLTEGFEGRRIELRDESGADESDADGEDEADDDLSFEDVDFGVRYPKK